MKVKDRDCLAQLHLNLQHLNNACNKISPLQLQGSMLFSAIGNLPVTAAELTSMIRKHCIHMIIL